MDPIRTRFAPCPTGFLHIGGARTALYNWAFTRRRGGRFVLRIEDTDRERSTAESEAAVLGGLGWLGIDWDEGPFRQSERGELHRAAIERLLATDRAYRCICTPAEIEERRAATVATGAKWTYDGRCADANYGEDCGAHAVRLRVPKEGLLGFDDLVFGPSGQDARELGDMVIRRSDGTPLYHLAVVVDDIEMGITHVIRGADHLNNTSFQLALYRALDAAPPLFAHLPLIVGANGKKLSKRRDPVSVQHFRAAGYLPEAMCNWLVRIGWSHGDQEIFSRDEIRVLFDLRRGAARFGSGRSRQARLVEPALDQGDAARTTGARAAAVPRRSAGPRWNRALRSKASSTCCASDRRRSARWRSARASSRSRTRRSSTSPTQCASTGRRSRVPAVRDLAAELAELETWDLASIEAAFHACSRATSGLALGKLAQPVRVAVTGSAASPGIFETLALLGRERSVARLERAVAELPAS